MYNALQICIVSKLKLTAYINKSVKKSIEDDENMIKYDMKQSTEHRAPSTEHRAFS
ncbi:hypothetical protein [Gilliamella sp. Nev5-1]|uniref:hypothetical protein n=1 Tax=Gilliamella sp. Nev5-1 TaxID=3120251 RepID=UPI0015CF57AB|nr:hypothetical protein [Gilliamella apicola]